MTDVVTQKRSSPRLIRSGADTTSTSDLGQRSSALRRSCSEGSGLGGSPVAPTILRPRSVQRQRSPGVALVEAARSGRAAFRRVLTPAEKAAHNNSTGRRTAPLAESTSRQLSTLRTDFMQKATLIVSRASPSRQAVIEGRCPAPFGLPREYTCFAGVALAQMCAVLAHVLALCLVVAGGATHDERVWLAYVCAAAAILGAANVAVALRAVLLPCGTALATAELIAACLGAHYVYAAFGTTLDRMRGLLWGWLPVQLVLVAIQLLAGAACAPTTAARLYTIFWCA